MERLVAGKMAFDLQRQSLLPLIEQAIEANRTYGIERGVTLALICDATQNALEHEVVVDSQRLMQVLSNLLSNAIKYAPDHGAGIPAAFHARNFKNFPRQTHPTRGKKAARAWV